MFTIGCRHVFEFDSISNRLDVAIPCEISCTVLAMGTPSPFGAVTIKATHDVASELKLSPPKCNILRGLAKVGGEAPFSWDDFKVRKSNAKTLLEHQAIDDAENAVVDLINDSYIREREYVTAGSRVVRGTIRLTDKGRNVVAELERFALVASPVRPMSGEEIAHEMLKA
jgi:hypothetical protein